MLALRSLIIFQNLAKLLLAFPLDLLLKTLIYISTGGFSTKTGYSTALEFLDNGIYDVELSGGQYSKNVGQDLFSLLEDLNLQIHNYFPPPIKPFVFNLASKNEIIYDKSFKHVCSCIDLASKLGLSRYSFHGGFRISPEISQLGRELGVHELTKKDEATEIFENALLQLSKIAKTKNIELLIENNVLTNVNLELYGESPLLLCEPREISLFMNKMPENVGLLLDLGHLKVSALTLGFDPVIAHEQLNTWTRAYHLSDNNGKTDSNGSITEGSWFWEIINPNLNYYSLEVYGLSYDRLRMQRELVSKKLNFG